jgi:D-alanyl-D-alanine carboxypeptidase
MLHSRRWLVVSFAAFTAAMVAGAVAPAVAQAPIAKIVAPDGAWDDELGTSVDVSGTRAIVGAPGDDDLGTNSGSAYVVDLSTGTVLYKLEGADT